MKKDLNLKCSICRAEKSIYVVDSAVLVCKKCMNEKYEPPIDHIEAFELIRNSGKYNIIMDVKEILTEPVMLGITPDDYLAIIKFLDRRKS